MQGGASSTCFVHCPMKLKIAGLIIIQPMILNIFVAFHEGKLSFRVVVAD